MVPWHYERARDLKQTFVERLRQFPRQPNLLWSGIRLLVALIVRGWLRVYHRLRIVGSENLPAEGSFILVANHSSHLDTLCLLAALPLRKLHRTFPRRRRITSLPACREWLSPCWWPMHCPSNADCTCAGAWGCAASFWRFRETC